MAATCSKALYRVKTMDSLDYRDLVCVFLNIISPIAICQSLNTYCHCFCFIFSLKMFIQFDTRRLFSYSSAEGGKFPCAQLKSEFEMQTCKHQFEKSRLIWKADMAHHATYTRVI